MARVFISYRRQVSSGHARALYDRLAQRFPDQVFMDVAGSIAPGVDFVDAIEKAIGSCKVLLVMIGRDWVSEDGQASRLEDPNDFVRLEIAAALNRSVLVVPVLVEDARMPSASELPKDIARLARIQAIELRDTRWDADVDTLISELLRMTKTSEPAKTTASRAEVEVVEETPRNQGRRRPLVAIALGAVMLFAALLGAYLLWGRESRGDEVPNVVGLLVDRAQERLQSEGLALGDVTTQRTSRARSKEVLEQSPSPGTKATRGMRVSLVIAGGRVVPNVVGKDLEAASAELRAAGFEIRVSREPTAQSRPNSVLRINPAVGTEVSEVSLAVELVVAAAIDASIVVPNVVGRVVADAMTQLQDAGFRPRRSEGTRNPRIPDLQVVAQDPAAGARVTRGGVVVIQYNPGPDVTPSAVKNVTITYPDNNRERQAQDLAQQFEGTGWQVTVKSGDPAMRGGRVVFFVRSDEATAQGIASRATAWLKRQGNQGRSFSVEFVTPTRGTNAATGGYFMIYTF